jgi:hypothetical protein
MGTHRAISDFYSANPRRSQTTAAAATAPTSVMRKFYKYGAMNNLGISADDETLDERVMRLAGNIASNIRAAQNAHSKGDIVKGLDMSQDFTSTLQLLDNLANGTGKRGREAQKELLRIATKIGLTDKTEWDTYFGELDDLS